MGCDLIFHLISASKYHKYLRPKLVEYYGGINVLRAEISERQRLKIAIFRRNLINGSIENLLGTQKERQNGPVQKYLNSRGSQNEDLYQEIYKLFQTKAKQIYYQRNQFLRFDSYLQQIDSFHQRFYHLKISNTHQVKNYCEYIQRIKQVLKQNPQCEWASEYDDIGDAEQIIVDCYKQMKQSKEEKLLMFKSGW